MQVRAVSALAESIINIKHVEFLVIGFVSYLCRSCGRFVQWWL